MLGEFAVAGGRREPTGRLWRFYQIVARTRNDPERMTFAEEAEVEEMCGSRALAEDRPGRSRIDRYLEGAGDDPGAKRRAKRREAEDEAEGVEMMDELVESFLDAVPAREMAKLVKAHGREGAVAGIADRIGNLPLGARRAAPDPGDARQDLHRRDARRRKAPVLSRGEPMTSDPFAILGVDENAGDDDIKRRYLALVRSFPPDREPERFQTYRAAFEALHTERERLAAKLLARHGGALARLEAACLPPPEARGAGRVIEAQVAALLVAGVEQALTRWAEASRAGASQTPGSALPAGRT